MQLLIEKWTWNVNHSQEKMSSQTIKLVLPTSEGTKKSLKEGVQPWENVALRICDCWLVGGAEGQRTEGPVHIGKFLVGVMDALSSIRAGSREAVTLYETSIVFYPAGGSKIHVLHHPEGEINANTTLIGNPVSVEREIAVSELIAAIDLWIAWAIEVNPQLRAIPWFIEVLDRRQSL